MKTFTTLGSLKEILPTCKKALVLLGSTPNTDTVACALGIACALEKKGIETQVASPAEMRVEFSRLVGVDQVKKKIGNRNLVVSFDYSEEKVEKVSYNISDDGKKFNLVIAPKNGSTPLDPGSVQFDLSGAEADVVIMVGVGTYAELGEIYEHDRNVIEGSQTVALTLVPVETFAKFHAEASGCSCLSEMGAAWCVQLDLSLDEDSASNFLFGIEAVTQNFTAQTTTADTFETVATLLRAGATRQPPSGQGTLSPTQLPFMGSQQAAQTPPAGATNAFAQALSSKQNQAGSITPQQVSMTGEFKG